MNFVVLFIISFNSIISFHNDLLSFIKIPATDKFDKLCTQGQYSSHVVQSFVIVFTMIFKVIP